MKLCMHLAALAGIVVTPGAVAHHVFGILLVNGTASPPWKYVRDVAYLDGFVMHRPEYPDWVIAPEYPKTIPQMDLHNPNVTCGRSAFDAAAKTETADVLAGSEVGFRVSWSDGCENYHPNCEGTAIVQHDGPGQIYLSRAPNDDLESYRGDGDWFKIAYAGPASSTKWLLKREKEFNFTIPPTTPPGKYLMRIEQFWPTDTYNYSQWFVNCAHINIIGPGGGTPTGFAKFPGTYDINHPGILLPAEQQRPAEGERGLLDYQPPGPPVWSG